MREILQPFNSGHTFKCINAMKTQVRRIPLMVAFKVQWIKTFSLRSQFILKIAMNFVLLLQMEFLVDTDSSNMAVVDELTAGSINK